MNADRKKPGVAFWATVVVVVGLAAYSLSYGPALWVLRRALRHAPMTELHLWAVEAFGWFYHPLIEASLKWPPLDAYLWWCINFFG